MDPLSLLGIVVGITAILLGQYLEGGHLMTLVNGPAMLIVLGGTVGAIMVQSPAPVFTRAMRMLQWLVTPPPQVQAQEVKRIVAWSTVARREGLLGLEKHAEREPDLFTKKGLRLLVDGGDPQIIRAIMELDLNSRERRDIQAVKVIEGMGGYSPTIGIIGAVIGLIHVMGNLADPESLGGGIAVAFVATVYGVALANLVFLPAASKLRLVVGEQAHGREMLIEGLVAIAEGENPRSIEVKLMGFLN